MKNELFKLLSLEFNCSPEDFTKSENILTVSAINEGRRVYSPEKYFFHMVTTGRNAVVTADECLHPFLSEYIKSREGHMLFELPNLMPLEKELNKHGRTLSQTHHMFLPEKKVEPERDYPVKWFYDDEITQFYGDERFPNAICDEFKPERPDRIVVIDGGELELDDVPKKVFSQVERMKSIGLDVPQVTELSYLLKKSGIDMDGEIISEDECVEALYELLK